MAKAHTQRTRCSGGRAHVDTHRSYSLFAGVSVRCALLICRRHVSSVERRRPFSEVRCCGSRATGRACPDPAADTAADTSGNTAEGCAAAGRAARRRGLGPRRTAGSEAAAEE